jgi:plastocyanin
MILKKLLLGVIILATLCISGAAITYNSYVDLDYGFDRVTVADSSTYPSYPNYTNNVLTINASDTVSWGNTHNKDLDLNAKITIISQHNLWNEKDSYLRWNTRTFSYRFEKPGIYEVYVKENAKIHQTIVVNPIYDSFGNVINQEVNNTPVQGITDIDPLLPKPPYVFNSHNYKDYAKNTIGAYVTIIFLVILGILHILIKLRVIRKQ